MRNWLIALAVLAFSGVAAQAEDGPVQIYVHKEAETVKQEKRQQSEYLEYGPEQAKTESKRKFTSAPANYQASDGAMMFSLTPGQSRWEYGF